MMRKIIVLEGADSSGKTTLAKAIMERPGRHHYLHGLPYVGWVEDAHRGMLNAALRHAADGDTVVIDRHWVSEFIYGPLFRNRVAYDDETARRFDRLIRAHGIYILCVPGNSQRHEERFQEQHKAKLEMFATMTNVAEMFRRVSTGYMHHVGTGYLANYIRHGDFAMLRNECLIYDMDSTRPDQFVRTMREYVE